jgi:hypothetical protein
MDKAPWIDYSASTTIVGFSSVSVKRVWYQLSNNTLFYNVYISGASNATTFSFTLPMAVAGGNNIIAQACRVFNAGVVSAAPGMCFNTLGSNVVSVLRDFAGTAWTASGVKTVQAQGFYPYQ